RGESEDSKDHNGGRVLHLFSVRPSDTLHFELELRNIVPGDCRPFFDRLQPVFRLRSFRIVHLFHGHFFMAGAEGFEPPLAVLETAGLPLNLRPFSPVTSLSPDLSLLYFLMWLVLAALAAEFLQF